MYSLGGHQHRTVNMTASCFSTSAYIAHYNVNVRGRPSHYTTMVSSSVRIMHVSGTHSRASSEKRFPTPDPIPACLRQPRKTRRAPIQHSLPRNSNLLRQKSP